MTRRLLFAVALLGAPVLRAQTPTFSALANEAHVQGAANSAALAAAVSDAVEGDGLRLFPNNAVGAGRFGFSVAVSGSNAIVGAYADDASRGAAYAFQYDGTTWVPRGKLRANDGVGGDQFGWAVAISGDRVIITAPKDDGRGSAYGFVFNGATWSQRSKLVPQGTLDGDYGISVAMSGDRAIVGMSYTGTSTVTGSAFVYVASGTTWLQQQQIFANSGAPGDLFGFSVAISGGRALVGAFGDDNQRGSAFVFDFDGSNWVQRASLRGRYPDGTQVQPGDRFGSAVALSGDRALVGADEGGVGGSAGGSAYVFATANGTTWTQLQRLQASDRGDFQHRWDERFGASVALVGDIALVGAQYARVDPTATSNAQERGAAYLFKYDGTWTETQKLIAPDWALNDRFGAAVALSADAALVGAWVKDASQGAAYVFGTAEDLVILVNSLEDDPDPDPADGICDTDAGTPGSQCTLRGAIQTANAVAGEDRIEFDVSASFAGGIATITLESSLPEVTEPLAIDFFGAAKQDGTSPLVVVDGGDSIENGIVLTAGESTVRGMALVGFTGAAIRIEGPGGNTVAGNYLGVDPDGTTLRGNKVGVYIDASRENTIGGPDAADRNVFGIPPSPAGTAVGAMGVGIYVNADAADANRILGNYIGVAASGTAMIADPAARRSGVGVLIVGADSTVIGGAAASPGQAPANVISGLGLGIAVSHDTGDTQLAGAFDTSILGNLIGTNAVGTDSLSNGTGVYLLGGAFFSKVGGASSAEGNVISGNGIGIILSDGGSVAGDTGPIPPVGTRIVGNTIGLTANGLTPLGNFAGISAGGEEMPDGTQSPGVRGVEIGAPGFPRNLIAGNRLAGIFVHGSGYPEYEAPDAPPEDLALSYNFIRNNYVGLRADGQPALASDSLDIGVFIVDGARAVIGFENGRNVIGGHVIGLFLASDRNLVYSNYIGTDPSGVAARPNLYGLVLTGGDNFIGRPPEDGQPYTGDYVLRWGNLVSGNHYAGMALAPGIPEPDPDDLRRGAGLRLPGLAGLDLSGLATSRLAGLSAYMRRGGEGGPGFLVGNRVGVSATGAALPNGAGFEPDPDVPEAENGAGILAVGGDSFLIWNVIAGNVGDGLAVYETEGDDARANLISNFIGVSVMPGGAIEDLPNTRDGIFNLGGDVRIGLAPDDGDFPEIGDGGRNIVWNSGRNGITTASFGSLYLSDGSFLNNTGLAIDIGIAGPDGPGAPVGMLQAPQVFTPTIQIDTATSDTTLTIPGKAPPAVAGEGTITHRVEVYLSGTCDASGFGEGAVVFGTVAATPGEPYTLSIPLTDASSQIRQLADLGGTVTATVTQKRVGAGGVGTYYLTSEFSACERLALPEDVAEVVIGDGETGEVLDDPLGVVITANGTAPLAGQTGGTLYAARFGQQIVPYDGAFEGSATAPDASTVTPNAVSSNRSWTLRADGLENVTYSACLDVGGVGGVTNPQQLLVLHRVNAGQPWTPYNSTLDGTQLCAAGLTAWGDIGIGGDALVNPVPNEPDPESAPLAPAAFAVRAFPNPASGVMTVEVATPEAGTVRVAVFDALGREVAVVHAGPLAAGMHLLALDTSRLHAGIYILRASTPEAVVTRRLTVVR